MQKFARSILFAPLYLLDLLSRLWLLILGTFSQSLPALWNDVVNARLQSITRTVMHNSPTGKATISLYTPNKVCLTRAKTFSTKEPDTLRWIDEFGDDGPLFDIGANVGLYTTYYAVTKSGPVFAFEPSFFNLRLLAKNLNLNKVQHKVSVISNPLSAKTGINDFKLQSTVEGGALSSFGVAHGHDGEALEVKVNYLTLGLSLDAMFDAGLLTAPPKLIKIDVDGIEHIILSGARKTLANPACKTVLIEVNDNFAEMRSAVSEILTTAGFALRKKSVLIEDQASQFASTFNEIWVKP